MGQLLKKSMGKITDRINGIIAVYLKEFKRLPSHELFRECPSRLDFRAYEKFRQDEYKRMQERLEWATIKFDNLSSPTNQVNQTNQLDKKEK